MVWRSTRDLGSAGHWRVSPLGWYMEVPDTLVGIMEQGGMQSELVTAWGKGDRRGTQTLGSYAQEYFWHTLAGVRVSVSCSAGCTEVMVLGRGRNISGMRCCRCLGLSVPWQCRALGFIDAVALVPQRSSKPAGQTSVSGSQSLPQDREQP